MTRHGLSDRTLGAIQGVLANFPEVEKAILYGSRAKGVHKPGSDIDLTLFGDRLTHRIHSSIDSRLDDLLLPYEIDLSLFSRLKEQALIDHIRRVGIVIYSRQPSPAKTGSV